MRASIEKDPGLGFSACTWVKNALKCWEAVQGGKKSSLKTIELAVKRDKLVTDKPSKSKQPEVARIEFRAGGGLHGPEKPRCSASGIEK